MKAGHLAGMVVATLCLFNPSPFALNASTFSVEGGTLDVGTGTLSSDVTTIGPNAVLQGNGQVNGMVFVSGTVAPGSAPGEIGTLIFSGYLNFDSGHFFCDAGANESLDRLVVPGGFTGSGTIHPAASSNAIPLHQVVINGGTASSYYLLTNSSPTDWLLSTTGNLDLTLTYLTGDGNANAMPDWWEVTYFGGRTNAIASADQDGDGFKNAHEYRAGTDPLDDTSLLQFLSAQRSGTANVLEWQSVPGMTYRIVGWTNLMSYSPALLATGIPASAGSVTVWTNSTSGRVQLYAVQIHSP